MENMKQQKNDEIDRRAAQVTLDMLCEGRVKKRLEAQKHEMMGYSLLIIGSFILANAINWVVLEYMWTLAYQSWFALAFIMGIIYIGTAAMVFVIADMIGSSVLKMYSLLQGLEITWKK